jgi:hypothetical protein
MFKENSFIFSLYSTLNRLTALTKDRSLIDMYARFLKFEDEMTVISVVWREAQQFIDKYEKVKYLYIVF